MTGLMLLSLLMLLFFSVAANAAEGITSTRETDKFQDGKKIHDFFESIYENSKPYRGSPLPPRLDLVFVLDSSSSVGSSKQFNSLKKFIQGLVSRFSVSPSTTRVALILCSEKPTLHFSLSHFVNKECTVKSIKKAKFVGGQKCALGPSLQLTYRILLQSRRMTSLRYHPKPIVVIVSSSANENIPLTMLSALIRSQNLKTKVFFLSVGKPEKNAQDKNKVLFRKCSSCNYLAVNSPSDLKYQLMDKFTKSKGLNRKCYTNGITVYDECRRRCRCSNDQMVDCYRVRKDFTSMTLEERRLYIHALKTVSTVRPYKHVYDKMTSYHPRWFGEIHQLKYFFPWHRWYILIFENFLRHIDCRVTVPYWDWSRAISDGRLWRTDYLYDVWYPGPHALGGNGEGERLCVQNGPFREDAWNVSAFVNHGQSCLSREFNDCYAMDLPNRTVVDEYLAMPYKDFQYFEENVREIMHDSFHNAVGGVMSYDESANAPEFWFHHGFLDKTWADWQNRGLKFKYQYFTKVKSNLPGTTVKGVDFIDLSRQPSCIRVQYDPVKDTGFPDNIPDPTVKEARPISDCYEHDETDGEDNDGIYYDEDTMP